VIDLAFYDRPVLEVAPDLIGCVVRHGGTAGVIVETEAYHRSEPASHAWAGLTARTEPLFGPPGIAYVYRSYGIHALLNAVCDHVDSGAAVLIRALEPLDGIEVMRARRRVSRHRQGRRPQPRQQHQLGRRPAICGFRDPPVSSIDF
jgi:DNA-3-methyladenine glycosylase